MSDVDLSRQTERSDTDDEGRVAHIGNRTQVMRAYVTGEEITALCGKRFVPTRDPDQYPVCQRCRELLGRVQSGRAGSN